MNAICSGCKKLADLQVCFDCKYTLCEVCVSAHFAAWKSTADSKCQSTEEKLRAYNSQIDQFNQRSVKNLESLNNIEAKIQAQYTKLMMNLTKEKDELLSVVNQCKTENQVFVEFQNKNMAICSQLSRFREMSNSNPLMTDKAKMISMLVEQYETNIKQGGIEADTAFNDLRSKRIETIEHFEISPMPHDNYKFIGRLKTAELSLGSLDMSSFNMKPIKETLVSFRTAPTPPSAIFPQLHTQVLLGAAMHHQAEIPSSFEKWRVKCDQTKWDEECNIQADFTPAHLATCRNYLFSLNESDKCENLFIFDITSAGKIELKNTFKMGLSNVKGIAANPGYFAMSYSDVKSSELRGKNKSLKPSGVILYTRDLHMIKNKHEVLFDVPGGFKRPRGVAMSTEHLFVCDQELTSVFKMSIGTGELIHTVNIPNGHPTKCSINMSYMAVTDTLKNELNIFNLSDMSFVANKKVDAEKGSTCGPYDVCLTQDNLVIYKTSSDFKLVVSDVGLRDKFWFKNIRTSILGFNMLEVADRQHLVIGTKSSTKNKYTFVLFNN